MYCFVSQHFKIKTIFDIFVQTINLTVCLGSTKVMTLSKPFYPKNVPKRVIGLSGGIKNVILYTATYKKNVFSRFFDRNSCDKV